MSQPEKPLDGPSREQAHINMRGLKITLSLMILSMIQNSLL